MSRVSCRGPYANLTRNRMCGENIVERVKQLRWTKSKKLKIKEIGRERKIYTKIRERRMQDYRNKVCDTIELRATCYSFTYAHIHTIVLPLTLSR